MLYDKLKEHSTDGIYPMHMPGHKRNAKFMPEGLPFDIDVTEIHGFDDLRDPRGVLLETAKIAADFINGMPAEQLLNKYNK